MKKYYIETMGCQLNENDSEKIAGITEKAGFEHRMKTWMELVSKYAEKEKFNVSGFLKDMFESDNE